MLIELLLGRSVTAERLPFFVTCSNLEPVRIKRIRKKIVYGTHCLK